MFTGIIEEIGIVKTFKELQKSALIEVECKKVLEDTKIGDSIAINGVCQTVVKMDSNSFSAEVSLETLNVTNFKELKKGSEVNLERALTLNSRLGGHMVSGHVDGICKLSDVTKQNDFYVLAFNANEGILKYIINKGSVTINGISLTIAKLTQTGFELAIIPHTYENTNLKSLKIGQKVNIENDLIAKYVEKFLSTDNNVIVKSKSNLNEDFLKENGFI